MKKLIPLIGICSAGILLSCNQHQSPQQATDNNHINKDTTGLISWQVKGCAEQAGRPDTKFPSSGFYSDYPDLPVPGGEGVETNADSIVYTRNVTHLCCRQVKLSVERIGNDIHITEYWYRQGCKCRCSSTVRAVIRHLSKGDYRLIAIETGTDPFDDKPTGKRDTVMYQVISVR